MRDSESQNEATSVAILQVEAGNKGAGVPIRDHPASRLPPPDTGPAPPAPTADTIPIHRGASQSARSILDGHTCLSGPAFAV